MKKIKKIFCLLKGCGEPATYMRYTQFSGDHPFCTKHAKQQGDFKEVSSYYFWVRIKNKLKK